MNYDFQITKMKQARQDVQANNLANAVLALVDITGEVLAELKRHESSISSPSG